MSLEQKTILQSMLYYTLIGITIILSVMFMFAISPKDVMMYAKVIYWIWVLLLLCTVICDIACTIMAKGKFITGILNYVIAVLCIAMGIIVYFNLSNAGILLEENMYLFNRLVMFSELLTVLMISSYITGECISSNIKGIK